MLLFHGTSTAKVTSAIRAGLRGGQSMPAPRFKGARGAPWALSVTSLLMAAALLPPLHSRINYFNQILDTAVSSINTRSQQLKTIHGLLGFLYKFRLMSKEELMKSAKRPRRTVALS